MDPQKVTEKPEVRGRSIQFPPGSQTFYIGSPSSAVTSQVHKAQTLPAHHPIYISHDDIIQSSVISAYDRSRSLTPDHSRSMTYAQNPIYGRMGISPERPPISQHQEMIVSQDRAQGLRSIPENNLILNGINGNGLHGDYVEIYQPFPGAPSPSQRAVHARQAMSPPTVPSGPKVNLGRRAFSPPPNLQNYDYMQVVAGSATPHSTQQGTTFVVKGMRTQTAVVPQRATAAPQPVAGTTSQHVSTPGLPPSAQQSWRERSPVGRHSQPLSTACYSTPSSAHQRSHSYRVPATSERDHHSLVTRPRSITPSALDSTVGDTTRDRIDKMEHQLANLAAWVQTAVIQTGSSAGASSSIKSTPCLSSDNSPVTESASSSLTCIATDIPVLSQDMKSNILMIKHQADALRSDLRSLRRLQQINKESILETVDEAWKKIKDALLTVPGAENILIRQQRNEVDVIYSIYLEDKVHAERELADLEHAVEELRSDVLSHQCRVQISDVEGMALVLSHVTKQLGDLKVRFPKLQERLKHVMSAEMELIVKEEKFLKEEPDRLDNSLKKCKKLTGTLFTLKRLASVQEHRPPQHVALSVQAKIPTMEDKKAVLQNIQAMIPNHEARIQGIQAAETARLIKKKITTQQESLRFGKTLELATKALKPFSVAISSQSGPVTASLTVTSHSGPITYGLTTTSQSGPVTSGLMTTSQTGLVSSGMTTTSQSVTSGLTTTTQSVPVTVGFIPYTSPARTESDMSSAISFVMPMSTSTPKNASQYSLPLDISATSLSLLYPVMSPNHDSSPKCIQSSGQRDYQKVGVDEELGHGSDHKSNDKFTSGKIEKSVEFESEPATLHVTQSETGEQIVKSKKGDKHSTKTDVDLSNQTSAVRADFFISLSSPSSPTTSSSPITPVLSTVSPTETICSISSNARASPVHGEVTMQTKSSLVSLPSTLASTSVMSSQALYVNKPSSLPVTSSSALSTHAFSPASPSNGTQPSAKPRIAFTAIPKPSSPTKSTSSPLTPESPKYRISSNQQHTSSGISTSSVSSNKTVNIIQSKESANRPKKVPPPPPPRKSSKQPMPAVLAVSTTAVNGQHAKHKHIKGKNTQESDSQYLQEPKNKGCTDIVRTKQFAKIEVEAKIERKYSIGSLKQFTTPLLESKRDRKDDCQGKSHGLIGQQISVSNLNTDDKVKSVTQLEKGVDISKEDTQGKKKIDESIRKIVDGKVTNISAEKSDSNLSVDSNTDSNAEKSDNGEREGSIESNSSSSSLDSQKDVCVKRTAILDKNLLVIQANVEKTDHTADTIAASSETSSESANKDSCKSQKENVLLKKVKPTLPQRHVNLSSKSNSEEGETEESVKLERKDSTGTTE